MPAITYNGYTLPNTIEKFSYHEDEKALNFSCVFLLLSASASQLNSQSQEAETKLSEINKDFKLVFGGSTAKDITHAGNTGFLARPSISKITNDLATETSRAYKFSVNIQVPFDQSGYSYRREGHFSVAYAPTRQRTVSFRCVYTAGGANSAVQNYVAGGKTWAASVLAAIGGTYEIVSENWDEEHEEKILNASLVYKEILANQATGTINVASLVDPQATFSVTYDQATGAPQSTNLYAIPQVRVSINYNTRIDKEQIPIDTNMEAVYQNTVKPWLLAHARSVLGMENYSQAGSTYVIQSENKNVDPYSYVIGGNIVLSAPKTTQDIIAMDETLAFALDRNISVEKLWDGQAFTYNAWSQGAEWTLQRTTTISKLGMEPSAPPPYSIAAGAAAGGAAGGAGAGAAEAGARGTGFYYPGQEGQWIMRRSRSWTNKKNLGVGTPTAGLPAQSVFMYTSTFYEEYTFMVPVLPMAVFVYYD